MNVLIIEDEPAAIKRMTKLLEEIDPTIHVVGSAETISDSVRWIEDNETPDLAFFDVQLADGESFEIFQVAQSADDLLDAPRIGGMIRKKLRAVSLVSVLEIALVIAKR